MTEQGKRAIDVMRQRDVPEVRATLSPATQIDIDVASVDGRRKYAGRFRYKVPTLGDRIDIGTLKTQLLQALPASTDDSVMIAQMIAYLSITIDRKSAPAWWQESNAGIGLYDHAPVVTLYERALAYEAIFLGGGEDAEADRKGSAGESGSVADGDVVADVQSTPQRRTVVATFGKGSAGADPHGESADEAANSADAEPDWGTDEGAEI